MQTLHELPLPEAGLQRLRIMRINRKVRELSASTEAIAGDLHTALINNALYKGEAALNSTIALAIRIEEVTAKLRFGRDPQLLKRQRAGLAATSLDAKNFADTVKLEGRSFAVPQDVGEFHPPSAIERPIWTQKGSAVVDGFFFAGLCGSARRESRATRVTARYRLDAIYLTGGQV